MTTQHTPGKWLFSESDKSWVVAPAQTDATIIAYVGTTARSGTLGRAKTSEANARLIASAPDLLAALEALLADYNDTLSAFNYCREDLGRDIFERDPSADRASQAIARAKGEA